MATFKSSYSQEQEHKCKLCSKSSEENEKYRCGCYFCYNCLLKLNEKKVKTYKIKKMCPHPHPVESIVNKILKVKKENEEKIKVLSERINEKLANCEDTCTNCEDIVKTNFEFMRQELEISYESAVNKLNEWKESYNAKLKKFEEESLNNLKQKEKREAFTEYFRKAKAKANLVASDKACFSNVEILEDIDKEIDEKRDNFKLFMYANKKIEFKPPTVEADPSILGRIVTQFRDGKHGFDCTTIESENLKELYEFPLLNEAAKKSHNEKDGDGEASQDNNVGKSENIADKDTGDDDNDDDDDKAETDEEESDEDDVISLMEFQRPFMQPVFKISPICSDKLFICVNNMGAIYDLSGETSKQSTCGTSGIATQENKIYMIKNFGLYIYSNNFQFHGYSSICVGKDEEINAITCSDDFVYITTTGYKKVKGHDETVVEIAVYSTERGLSIVGNITKKDTIIRFIDHKKVEGDYMLKNYQYAPDLAGKNGKLYVWYAKDRDLDVIDEKTFRLIASFKTPKIESFNFNIMFELGEHYNKIVVDNDDSIILREKHVLVFCKIENKEFKVLKQVEFNDFADFCVTNNGRLAVLNNNLSIKIY